MSAKYRSGISVAYSEDTGFANCELIHFRNTKNWIYWMYVLSGSS